MSSVSGFEPYPVESAFTFADGVVTVARQIDASWIAVYALGELPRTAGFDGAEQAATTVLQCMAESPQFYRSFESRTDLESGAGKVESSPRGRSPRRCASTTRRSTRRVTTPRSSWSTTAMVPTGCSSASCRSVTDG